MNAFHSKVNPQMALTKVTLLGISTLTVLSSMTLSPDLPLIKHHFNSVAGAEVLIPLVLTLHALFIVLGAPLAGYAVDHFGRKPTLLLAALVYGLAGSAGFLLEDLTSLLFSRALLGLATAGTMVGATTLIADYYTGTTRTKLTGWQTAVMNFGGVGALLLSGILADFSWHAPFLIYLVGLGLVPLVGMYLVEPSRNKVMQLSGSVEAMERVANTNKETQKLHYQPAPIKILAGIYAIMFATMLLFFFVPVQLPFYLQKAMNVTTLQSGIALAAANLCTGLVALAYTRYHHHFDRLPLIALGFGGLGLGLLLIGSTSLYPVAVVGAFLTGTAAGIVLPTLGLWIMEVTPLAVRGRALSGLTASIFGGQFLSPFVSQPLQKALGFNSTYLIAGSVSLCLVLALVLRSHSTSLPNPQTEV